LAPDLFYRQRRVYGDYFSIFCFGLLQAIPQARHFPHRLSILLLCLIQDELFCQYLAQVKVRLREGRTQADGFLIGRLRLRQIPRQKG
jgi:hypothetical protein